MAQKASGAAPRRAPQFVRRLPWVVAFCAGLAAAALVGAGQSDAQDDYYPTYPPTTSPGTTTPTTTSPGTTPLPGFAPTTTSPTSAPPPISTPRKNTVVIKGTSGDTYRFAPRRLRIRRGKRVTWTWNSNAPHNVVFRRPRKRSKTTSRGEFKLRFRKRGTYRYLCTVHDFGGRIVVR